MNSDLKWKGLSTDLIEWDEPQYIGNRKQRRRKAALDRKKNRRGKLPTFIHASRAI